MNSEVIKVRLKKNVKLCNIFWELWVDPNSPIAHCNCVNIQILLFFTLSLRDGEHFELKGLNKLILNLFLNATFLLRHVQLISMWQITLADILATNSYSLPSP